MPESGSPWTRPPKDKRQKARGMVAEIMEQAAEKAAAQAATRQVKEKRKGKLLLILLPILVAFTAWNIVRAGSTPEPFSDVELVDGARMAVYVVAEALLKHRDSTGVLPENLDALGLGDLPVRYEIEVGDFRVSASERGRIVSYRSGQDLQAFAAQVVPPPDTSR